MRKTPLGLALACLLSGGAVTLSPGALAEVTVIPVTGAELSEQLTGIVTIVNLERRMLTIRTPEGRFEVIHVPPEAKRAGRSRSGPPPRASSSASKAGDRPARSWIH